MKTLEHLSKLQRLTMSTQLTYINERDNLRNELKYADLDYRNTALTLKRLEIVNEIIRRNKVKLSEIEDDLNDMKKTANK